MQAAEPNPLANHERLTWAEICQRYPDQQVYVIEAERTNPTHPDFLSAIVLGAGPTRAEAFEQAKPRWLAGQVLERRFTGRSKQPLLRPPVYLDGHEKPLLRPPVYMESSDLP